MRRVDPAFQPIANLIGTWKATGRTVGADADNITSEVTIKPILDGKYIEMRGSMTFKEYTFESVEIIYYDPLRDVFPSTAYAGIDDGPGSKPMSYEWYVEEDGTIVHRGAGAIYRGKFNKRGDVLEGGWRPDNTSGDRDEASYDMTMTKV